MCSRAREELVGVQSVDPALPLSRGHLRRRRRRRHRHRHGTGGGCRRLVEQCLAQGKLLLDSLLTGAILAPPNVAPAQGAAFVDEGYHHREVEKAVFGVAQAPRPAATGTIARQGAIPLAVAAHLLLPVHPAVKACPVAVHRGGHIRPIGRDEGTPQVYVLALWTRRAASKNARPDRACVGLAQVPVFDHDRLGFASPRQVPEHGLLPVQQPLLLLEALAVSPAQELLRRHIVRRGSEALIQRTMEVRPDLAARYVAADVAAALLTVRAGQEARAAHLARHIRPVGAGALQRHGAVDGAQAMHVASLGLGDAEGPLVHPHAPRVPRVFLFHAVLDAPHHERAVRVASAT
mmetsp:Transcript_7087/g.27162  ORF Transcript_7087/g.27162 Transcript_7087/m.27162 type:complete len:349 (-) Transcript_7087:162-1208(-)